MDEELAEATTHAIASTLRPLFWSVMAADFSGCVARRPGCNCFGVYVAGSLRRAAALSFMTSEYIHIVRAETIVHGNIFKKPLTGVPKADLLARQVADDAFENRSVADKISHAAFLLHVEPEPFHQDREDR